MSTVPTTKKACIFGAGAFGFAIASLLGDQNPEYKVVLYDPVKSYIDLIINERRHPVFHPGIQLPANCTGSHNVEEAVKDADLVFLAVPAAYLRSCVAKIAPSVNCSPTTFVNVAKALEPESNKYGSEIVIEELKKGCKQPYHFAALAGGMIADEVTRKWPIAADLACEDISVARRIQGMLQSPTFRILVTDDVVGVELAGALKNVMAIGAGFFDGIGYDASSKAAYVSTGANEMRSLAIAMGAKASTFDLGSHAWLNDLLTTCFGKSRNRYFGELIGKGNSVEDALAILAKEKKRSEGYVSVPGLYKIAKDKGVNTPILDTIKAVLLDGKKPQDVILDMFKPSKL